MNFERAIVKTEIILIDKDNKRPEVIGGGVMLRIGSRASRVLSLVIILLLTLGLAPPPVEAPLVQNPIEDKLYTEYSDWVYHPIQLRRNITITLDVSTHEWKKGETVTVTAICTEDSVYGVNGFTIGFHTIYGEVEVVSMSPPISATNDPTEGLCLGGVVGVGAEGGLSVQWQVAANANERGTSDFDSPAVFTVTFRLGNPNPNIPRGSDYNGGELQPFIYANGGSAFPPFTARAIAMIRVKSSDRLSGKVYDIQTNFPNSAAIKAVPMPNTKVWLYSLPDKKLVVQNVSGADGSYIIKPEKFNPDLSYLLVANATSDGKKIRQEIEVNTLNELDIYLPKSIVHNYISLIEGLDAIILPLMTDEDLALGIGTGGPLKETSLFGSLADLERYDIEVNTSEGSTLKEDLVSYLDEILEDPPVCRDLRGSAVSGDPWASLLRLGLFMAYVKDRVPDAYVSIDNAVKGLTVAIMTNLMMGGIQSKGKGWQSYVDKYTPKQIQGAQNWLLDKGNKNMLKIANTIHVTIFSGAFGLQGVDKLLTEAGITDPTTKSYWKMFLAKGIRFLLTDFIRKNIGTSGVFEIIFQGTRTIGDYALLQLYLLSTRNQLKTALQLTKQNLVIGSNQVAMNLVSVG